MEPLPAPRSLFLSHPPLPFVTPVTVRSKTCCSLFTTPSQHQCFQAPSGSSRRRYIHAPYSRSLPRALERTAPSCFGLQQFADTFRLVGGNPISGGAVFHMPRPGAVLAG